MARLVFGESLSPDEIRRVHLTSSDVNACSRFDLPESRRRTARECADCRLRFECGMRVDDLALANAAMRRALRTLAAECAAGRRCVDWPRCGHVGEQHDGGTR